MLGDLRLFIKRFWKQQFACNHDYQAKVINAYPTYHYEECSKCGKWKK